MASVLQLSKILKIAAAHGVWAGGKMLQHMQLLSVSPTCCQVACSRLCNHLSPAELAADMIEAPIMLNAPELPSLRCFPHWESFQ